MGGKHMETGMSRSRKAFLIANNIFLGLVTIICIVPIVNVLATSLSHPKLVDAGRVFLWPVEPTLDAYVYVFHNTRFWESALVTLKRLAVGVPLNMILIVLAAYPLSKRVSHFKARKYYSAFFVFTILFNGGLIPTYLVVVNTGLIDTIFALVLPGAVGVFSVILVTNFFRAIPSEIEEAAYMDGAGHFSSLFRIYVPLSTPVLATVLLSSVLNHWNSWFDGLIYMNKTSNYPLQSYLQTVLIATTQIKVETGEAIDVQRLMASLQFNSRTLRASQIFISMIPILLVYPFLQRYFTTGIVLGSVKG